MKPKTIKLPFAFDAHLHLRDGDQLANVAPLSAQHFSAAIIMPNLTPAVRTVLDVSQYRERIMTTIGDNTPFEPLMTVKIYPDTDPDSLRTLIGPRNKRLAIAGKVYPKGLTTNAEDGVEDYFALFPVFKQMEDMGLVLCLHGEKPGSNIEGMDRESKFLRTLYYIANTFPDLQIVMEHITTEASVDAILNLPDNISATITAHHLMLTYDDVGGDRMRPHNWCKPVAKRASDRDALIESAISGCPKFFFGSDSAPHPKEKKESAECCAGVFTAPIALPLLAQIFDQHHALDRLAGFIGKFARKFYNVSHMPERPIMLVNTPMKVPSEYGGVVPFMANQQLQWSVQE